MKSEPEGVYWCGSRGNLLLGSLLLVRLLLGSITTGWPYPFLLSLVGLSRFQPKAVKFTSLTSSGLCRVLAVKKKSLVSSTSRLSVRYSRILKFTTATNNTVFTNRIGFVQWYICDARKSWKTHLPKK